MRTGSGVCNALLINGTVGSGKSTTADEVGNLLYARSVAHSIIDLDALRRTWPTPDDDPFNQRLTLANLADVARNCRRAGAHRLVLSGVMERPEDRLGIEQALGEPFASCRLVVAPDELQRRLMARHRPGVEREWYLRRAPELDAILDASKADDHLIEVGDGAPDRVAELIVQAIGWQ